MKKIISLLLLLSFTGLVSCTDDFSPIEEVQEVIEQLKLEDTRKCQSCSIKFMDNNYSSGVSYYITPSGFEMDKLDERGYNMKITVSYQVSYVKDYNVLWDIGYAGSPKYEISILNTDGIGNYESDLTTTTSKVTRKLSISSPIANIKNQRWVLSFSTDNIQNIIHFDNIIVNYNCFK